MKKEVKRTKYFYIIVLLILILVGYSVYYYYKSGANYGIQTQEGTVVHWHPEVYIKICGEDKNLPLESVGLSRGEEDYNFRLQLHTHKNKHELHLGEGGPVNDPETFFTLGKAMKALDINFNEQCIMDKCNGDLCDENEGRLKVLSNGNEIQDFINHGLKDKERIDIIFG